jgi:hypothetical protein
MYAIDIKATNSQKFIIFQNNQNPKIIIKNILLQSMINFVKIPVKTVKFLILKFIFLFLFKESVMFFVSSNHLLFCKISNFVIKTFTNLLVNAIFNSLLSILSDFAFFCRIYVKYRVKINKITKAKA